MILFLIAFLCAVFASACFLKEILQKQEKYPQAGKGLDGSFHAASPVHCLSRLIWTSFRSSISEHFTAHISSWRCLSFWNGCCAYSTKSILLRAEILSESSSRRPGTGIDTVPGAYLSALFRGLSQIRAAAFRCAAGGQRNSKTMTARSRFPAKTEMVLTFTGIQQEVGTIDTDVSFAAGGKRQL